MNELDTLIAEQAKDDTYRVFSVSVDSWPNGADLPERRKQLVTDPRHGTLNCYIHLRCRCVKCKAASAEAKREERRRNHVDRGPYVYALCCQDCGGGNVKRQRVYETGA